MIRTFEVNIETIDRGVFQDNSYLRMFRVIKDEWNGVNIERE